MKKFNSILVAAMGMAALTVSCKQEGLEPVAPEEGQTIKVEVSLGETLKGTFTDREGLRWEVGDVLWCWDWDKNEKFESEALTAEDLSTDHTTASFTFPKELISEDREIEFVSPNNHPSNKMEVTFTMNDDVNLCPEFNSFTQDEAGSINKRRLFLHNGNALITNAKGNVPKVKMEICGTIVRVMPYTTTHNDEEVRSVQLNTKAGTNLIGTVVYDRKNGTYTSATEKKFAAHNNIKATLKTSFSLDGVTSKGSSKGIYLPIPATAKGESFEGYQVTVETDKGVYLFLTDKALTVSENAVKNIYLNLEKGSTGLLRYFGSIGESKDDIVVPSASNANMDLGFWQAQVSSNGSAWEDRLNAENKAFYDNVVFECKDAVTGEPVDWVSVTYGADDCCHWMANIKENVGEERSAIITGTFSNVDGYALENGYKTVSRKLVQKAAGAVKVLDFQNGIGDTVIDPEEKETDLNWYAIRVDGQTIEGTDARNDELYGNATFTAYVGGVGSEVADWLTVSYKPKSTWVAVKALKNVGAERKALVYCEFKAPEGYEFKEGIPGYKDKTTAYMQFFVTQKSGMVVTASFDGVYSGLVPAAGETITAANLKVEVNGVAVSDYTKLSEYGLDLSASAGTVSVAADGKVTLVVPENKPNKEKTYTISLKQESKVIASCKIKQEAGDGSGAVGHTYSYNIFNDKPDGSKDTGFGPGKGFVGNYYRIENVTIDGKTYQPGDDMKNLVNDTELINALTSHIFSFGEITESDVQVSGTDPLTTDPETFVELVPWTDGGAAIYFGIVFKNENTTGARRTFKVITKDGEGKVTSTIVYFQNA